MSEEFIFCRFLADEDPDFLETCERAAREKLETLYPLKKIISGDSFSIAIESDSYLAENGVETYLIGMVDDEIPAIQRVSDGQIITFRV